VGKWWCNECCLLFDVYLSVVLVMQCFWHPMLLEPTALFTFADAPDHLWISGTECLQAGCRMSFMSPDEQYQSTDGNH